MSTIKNLNPNAGNQSFQQPQITKEMLDKGVSLGCASCGGIYITPVVEYKRISKIYLGAPQDMIVPIPTNRCSDCGEIFDMEEAFSRAAEEK